MSRTGTVFSFGFALPTRRSFTPMISFCAVKSDKSCTSCSICASKIQGDCNLAVFVTVRFHLADLAVPHIDGRTLRFAQFAQDLQQLRLRLRGGVRLDQSLFALGKLGGNLLENFLLPWYGGRQLTQARKPLLG